MASKPNPPRPPRPPIASLVDLFSDEFGDMASQIIPEIRSNLDLGMNPRTAVLRALQKFNVDQRITDSILDKLVAAAAIGFGVEPSAVIDAVGIRKTFLNNHWDGDAFTLSQRIARAEYKQIIVDTVDAQMRRSGDWQKVARSIDEKRVLSGALPRYIERLETEAKKNFGDQPELKADFLKAMKAARKRVDKLSLGGAPNQTVKAIYNEILRAADTLDDKAMDKAIHQAVKDKARYNAERIARTEMARAYGAGVDLRQLQDTDVIAERIVLSTRHPFPDICNFHTSADLYGMGPGVYPKTRKPPYPFHPHCLCVKTDVFEGEVELETEMDPAQGRKYLAKLSLQHQQALLGVEGQKEFAKNPNSWQRHLKNWKGHQPVKGVEGLKPEMFAAPKQATAPIPKPETLEGKLAQVEARIRQQRFESAAAYAPDGREILFKNGAATSVTFTGQEVQSMKDAVVTHNHPRGWGFDEKDPRRGGNSFSLDDIALAAKAGAREMRAVSPWYDFSIKPGPQGWNIEFLKQKIAPTFNKHDFDVYSESMVKIDSGILSQAQAEADHYHVVWTRVADELGLNYSRTRITP